MSSRPSALTSQCRDDRVDNTSTWPCAFALAAMDLTSTKHFARQYWMPDNAKGGVNHQVFRISRANGECDLFGIVYIEVFCLLFMPPENPQPRLSNAKSRSYDLGLPQESTRGCGEIPKLHPGFEGANKVYARRIKSIGQPQSHPALFRMCIRR